MSKRTTWKSIKSRRMKEPGARQGYEEAALAFALAEQVRTIREDKGFSQSELANAMGTTQSSIARLEGGGIAPTIPTLKKLADALGVELFLGFNDPRAGRGKPKGKAVGASGSRIRTLVAATSAEKTVAKVARASTSGGKRRSGSRRRVAAKTAAKKASRRS